MSDVTLDDGLSTNPGGGGPFPEAPAPSGPPTQPTSGSPLGARPGRGDGEWGPGTPNDWIRDDIRNDPGGGPTPPSQAQQDAHAAIRLVLERYGLESLLDWAWEQIVANRSETQILQSLREQEAYRVRFQAIFDREATGLPPVSPEEVLAYERQAVALMRNYGFPQGFYDDVGDLARLMVNDISAAELERRLQGYVESAVNAPAEYRDALESLYGFGPGDLAAMWADPETAMSVLERRWRATALGGEALSQGFGPLTAAEAEGLAGRGVDAQAGREGFGVLAESRELFGALDSGETGIGRETQLGAISGDAQSQQEIEARRRRRQAGFSGGGSFASGGDGIGGVGRSS